MPLGQVGFTATSSLSLSFSFIRPFYLHMAKSWCLTRVMTSWRDQSDVTAGTPSSPPQHHTYTHTKTKTVFRNCCIYWNTNCEIFYFSGLQMMNGKTLKLFMYFLLIFLHLYVCSNLDSTSPELKQKTTKTYSSFCVCVCSCNCYTLSTKICNLLANCEHFWRHLVSLMVKTCYEGWC